MKKRVLLYFGVLTVFIFTGCSSSSDVPMPEPEKIQPIHIQQMEELVEIESSTNYLRQKAAMMMSENFKDMKTISRGRGTSLSENRFDDVLSDFKSER